MYDERDFVRTDLAGRLRRVYEMDMIHYNILHESQNSDGSWHIKIEFWDPRNPLGAKRQRVFKSYRRQ